MNREQLEQAITALEAQRATLGDAVVDTALASMREKLDALRPASLHLDGERKLVTILLSDVKGSTDLAEHLSMETWVEVMNRLFQIMETEVYRFGGEVNQFRGDGLLAFFGANMVHEDDPERAVLAALAIQEAVQPYAEEVRAREGVALCLRVGINTGEVIVTNVGDSRQYSEDTAMGRSVALAARMESAAEPGTVLVAEGTYRLVHTQFVWEALGEIMVKGVHQPVLVYRPLAYRPAPGKARGIAGLAAPLVGRDEEFRAVQGAVTRLLAGEGGIVTLVGEAGLGKSRLIAELHQWWRRHLSQSVVAPEVPHQEGLSEPNARWVEGRCVSYGENSAYLFWVDLLRALLIGENLPDEAKLSDVLRACIQRFCPEHVEETYTYLNALLSHKLEALVGESGVHSATPKPTLKGEGFRRAVSEALLRLIAGYAQHAPLLIVCEDLHWADAPSLRVLERLFSLTAQVPVLFLCIFRPDAAHASWHILQAARPYSHVDISLLPLSEADSHSLVGHLLYLDGLLAQLRERVLRYAEGNPFYIEEIIRSLLDSQAITYDAVTGYWKMSQDVVDIPIPDTLQGVLMARIDRLPPATKYVLQVASVIGRIFRYRVLAVLVLMQSQPSERVPAFVLRVISEPDCSELQDLAQHLQTLQELTLLRERSDEPDQTYIFKHHLTQQAAYNSLLEKERRRLHQQVAEVLKELFSLNLWDYAELLAYHWECAGEPGHALPHLIRAADKATYRFANAEALAYLTRALDAARTAKLALAEADVLYRLSKVTRNQGDYHEAKTYLEQALPIYRNFGNQRRVGMLLSELGLLARRQGNSAEAEAHFEQTLDISRLVGYREGEVIALNNLGLVAQDQGDYSEAIAYFEQALRMSRRIKYEWGQGIALGNLGAILLCLGDDQQAESYLEQALTLHRTVSWDRRAEARLLVHVAMLFQYRRDYASAYDHAQQALTIAQEVDDESQQGCAWMAVGHAACALMRLGEAEHAYTQALELRQALGEHHVAVESLAGLARICQFQGDLDRAVQHVEDILRYQGSRFVGSHFLGCRYLETNPFLYGVVEPFRVYLTCYQVLDACGDARAAEILDLAYQLLQARAAKIKAADLRTSFLEDIAAHRELTEAWEKIQL